MLENHLLLLTHLTNLTHLTTPTPMRLSKISMLPAAVRDDVNLMLYDGKPFAGVITCPAENGHGRFNKANLSRWKEHGYQDWLTAQERREERQYKHELAQQQAASADPVYHDAGVSIVTQEFYDAFSRLDFDE